MLDVLEKSLQAGEPLEISTYLSQDMEGVRYSAQSVSGARLVLLTRILPGGEAQLVIPEDASAIDPALWNYHMEMVRQAQAARLEQARDPCLRRLRPGSSAQATRLKFTSSQSKSIYLKMDEKTDFVGCAASPHTPQNRNIPNFRKG